MNIKKYLDTQHNLMSNENKIELNNLLGAKDKRIKELERLVEDGYFEGQVDGQNLCMNEADRKEYNQAWEYSDTYKRLKESK